MSRTENRYGQATIPPGSSRADVLDTLMAAVSNALTPETFDGTVLFDQIQISSEIVANEERTFSGTQRTNERNVLTVRLPVVFDD